jgi:DNA polymerase I-like protein with 3'-5' exonuclease and polymerase domains|tara:strand:+ start:2111 stop:3901 length:1791 start_codon:yes stop_codon:yes gene_type:complete
MRDIVFDIEANGFLEDATEIHCISIAENGEEPECFDSKNLNEALHWLERATNLIGHNIVRYDLPLLKKLHGWDPPAWTNIQDTFIQARMVFPDLLQKDAERKKIPRTEWGKYSLRSFGHRLKMHKGDHYDFSVYSLEMRDYCIQDVRVTQKLWEILKKQNISKEAVLMETEFAALAFRMEKVGIAFDRPAAIDLFKQLDEKREEILDALVDLVPPKRTEMKTPQYWIDPVTDVQFVRKSDAPSGIRKELVPGPLKVKEERFNPMSRPQVAEFLVTRGWEPSAKTATGQVKVDESILSQISDIPEASMIADLYRVQKIFAMLAGDRRGWLSLEREGRLHPRIKTLGAYSGRTSCVDPNLQQVPSTRLPFGKECRSLFVAADGKVLVGCDAKSLEVRCFAHYMAKYDDGEFADVVLRGDIHQANADMMECDRQTAKNTFFALIYGASSRKIAAMLGIPMRRASGLVTRLFEERPAMRRLINKVKKSASSYGQFKGLDGRMLKPRSEHSAVNLLVQSAGACVSKRAALNFEFEIISNRWDDTHIVGFIHDEMIIETPDDNLKEVCLAAIHSFQKTTDQYKLRCPMDGDAQIGLNWSEIH